MTAVLSMRVANQATSASKSAVKPESSTGRAKGTASVRTPCSGQRKRRRLARTSRCQEPRSRWRQRDSTGRES